MFKASKLTKLLLIFTIGNLVLSLFLHDLHSVTFFDIRKNVDDDSLDPIYRALHVTEQYHSPQIYEELFFKARIKFQYPPPSLLVFLPFKNVDHEYFISFFGLVVNRILILVSVIILFLLFNTLFRRKTDSRFDSILKKGSFFVLVFSFYPFFRAYSLGQMQVWINCFLLISIFCWLHKKEKTAGVFLGLCTLIKPTYGVVLLWGLLRKKKSFVHAAGITVFLGLLLSVPFFGFQNLLDYGKVSSFISKHGESYFPNNSLNGLTHRLLFNGNNLNWEPNAFPPFNWTVYTVTLFGLLFFLGIALLKFNKKYKNKGKITDVLILLLSVTMASPIAWEHHYGFIIAIYVIVAYMIYSSNLRSKGLLWALLACSYLLTSHFLAFLNRFAATHYNFLQSYLFFGALVLLGLLYYIHIKIPFEMKNMKI